MSEVETKSLPESAYRALSQGEAYPPIIAAEQRVPELTARSIAWGTAFCVIFTVAAAYSVRPTADARVSAPLAWDEIDTCDPRDFTLATMPRRFAGRRTCRA